MGLHVPCLTYCSGRLQHKHVFVQNMNLSQRKMEQSGIRNDAAPSTTLMQDVSDSGHLTSPSNPVSTPKGSAATPPPASPSAPSSPVRPSAYRSMSDTRVKKFDKLLGEQVVSHLSSMPAVSAHNNSCELSL